MGIISLEVVIKKVKKDGLSIVEYIKRETGIKKVNKLKKVKA
jgi:hypothetical protein